MNNSTTALVICSGGLDSVTLAWKIASENRLDALLSFDYGQKHIKEIEFAKKCAESLGVDHQVVDISSVGTVLTGSALTDEIDVPDGHYAEENMKLTIVPNRNAIMLSIAFGAAVSRHVGQVSTAVHGGDHFIYPDCRPGFINSFEEMQQYALEDVASVSLDAPFLNIAKSDIVILGNQLSVPFSDTWSCYKGGENHCGRCGTCVERQEAFSIAGINDPTIYEDADYWRSLTTKEI